MPLIKSKCFFNRWQTHGRKKNNTPTKQLSIWKNKNNFVVPETLTISRIMINGYYINIHGEFHILFSFSCTYFIWTNLYKCAHIWNEFVYSNQINFIHSITIWIDIGCKFPQNQRWIRRRKLVQRIFMKFIWFDWITKYIWVEFPSMIFVANQS